MECGVCLGGGDSDCYWEFYENATRAARKNHKCCECGRVIATGTKYDYFVGKIDGGLEAYKTCLDCSHIRYGLWCGDGAMSAFGNLWSDIYEVFPHLKSTACLQKIKTPSAKAYFLERWRQWKFKE